MSTKLATVWDITPHTATKHKILRAYFTAWFSIVAQKYRSVVFVDGFCGPGEYNGGEPGSPIVVIKEIQKALASPRVHLRRDLSAGFYFIDDNKERIANLNKVLARVVISDSRIHLHPPLLGEFEQQISLILATITSRRPEIVPTLVFVDPFGPTGFSMQTIGTILGMPSAEIFLLLDLDGMDRLLTSGNAINMHHLTSACGVDEAQLEPIKKESTRARRLELFRRLYINSLRQKQIARKVLPFVIVDSNETVMHDLAFLTNDPLGFLKMKHAMWVADESGEFRFSEADLGGQLRLGLQDHEARLWEHLISRFQGQPINGSAVKQFVEQETLYLDKHKRRVLMQHESDRIPLEERVRVTNRKRVGTYPSGASIAFPRKAEI